MAKPDEMTKILIDECRCEQKRVDQIVIHVICGDAKFLASCRKNFEWLDTKVCSYWIITSSFVEVEQDAINAFNRFCKNIKSLVILHGLWPTQRSILTNIKKARQTSIIFLWGGDYSNQSLPLHFLFGRRTRKLKHDVEHGQGLLSFLFHEFRSRIFYQRFLQKSRKELQSILSNGDFLVCGWGEEEAKFLPHTEIDLLPSFNPYYPIAPHPKPQSLLHNPNSSGPIKVLLGNSGRWTCNHADAIDSLRTKNPGLDFQFSVLVSYGDQTYIEALKHLFAEDSRVLFVDEFMEREAYQKLIDEHHFLALGCMRQQGTGFIRAAIQSNKPLLLFKNSIAQKHLESKGVQVGLLDAPIDFNKVAACVQARDVIEAIEQSNFRRFQKSIFGLLADAN